MKIFFLSLFIVSIVQGNNNICNKSKEIVLALEAVVKKNCKDISESDLLTIKELWISDITELNPDSFSGLSNLEKLEVGYYYLNTIDSHTFSGMPNLKVLWIGSASRLISIASGAFARLPNLEELSLIRYNLPSIDPNIFTGLNKLKLLDWRSSAITTINSNNFAKLTSLTKLNLEYSFKLISVEKNGFSGLVNLKELVLTYAKSLASVGPKAFLGLHNLELLDMTINYIPKIDYDTFASLTKLKKLVMSHSRALSTITPTALKHLPNLEELDLQYSNLHDIESITFTGLSKLKKLNLASNKFTHLRAYTFKELTSLEELDISALRNLSSIESNALSGLSKLQILNLSQNPIMPIHSECFTGLDKLSELYLNDSENITDIEPNTFKYLTNLKVLNFANNKLSTIAPHMFEELANLEELSLENSTNLTLIEPNAFEKLTNLKKLNLKGAKKIVSLESNVFTGLTKLEELEWSDLNHDSITPDVFSTLTNLTKLKIQQNINDKTLAMIRAGLGTKCELTNAFQLSFIHPILSDPSSPYFCPATINPKETEIWQAEIKSLLFSSYSIFNPNWIGQMEDIIPLIHSSLKQFWVKNNSILNFYFTQMPSFSGNTSELHVIRQLAVDVCAIDTRFCETRERIHQYPGTSELSETQDFLKLLISENAPSEHIALTQNMEKHLQTLVYGSMDLNFWETNLPIQFKPILESLNVIIDDNKVDNEHSLLSYTSLAVKTRSIMEQMNDDEVHSHGTHAALFYTQLVREVKKLIAEINVYPNKKEVLHSLIDLGYAERLLTQHQVNSLKRLALKSDYDSLLSKYTTWAVERINFDLGGSAKNPDSWLFNYYNAIIKTSILNEVEKVIKQ